ncbi:lipoprotein-34 precursor (NlpB) [Acinetobacter shaoyimingii]|uniref:Lipoprotein-34 (NlpB) n=1 Tax=Acinetobacter shaoyimingii TaxID=2715164 RepID=A0A6G8RZL6_9GAMM|nr:lipoprotein-34 precursor (NlpB) [Acinetobacter shaoyimingii]QIO07304.1 lipoprotein-34 precursor (NlpB) [Acinetobacter shaoyimingii]
MQLRLGLTLVLSALSLVGCSKLSINNGSLDYIKKTTSHEPLKYPEGAMVRPETPLYPSPVVDPLAIENAPTYENQRGNRFELPRPNVTQSNTQLSETATVEVGRPQLLTDGNGNPLIKVEGNSDTIWQYTTATLSSLNLNVVAKGKNSPEVTIKVDGQNYVLKLSTTGSTNTLAVFDAKNNFADKQKAAELLTQIYQNWPA